jgi:hypothetical protein
MPMQPRHMDFQVAGDPATIKAAVQEALVGQRFRVTWQTAWSGVAEKGSKVASWLLGGAVDYLRLSVVIRSGPSGEVLLHIASESVGSFGGPASWVGYREGNANMAEAFDNLRPQLESDLSKVGALRGVQEH